MCDAVASSVFNPSLHQPIIYIFSLSLSPQLFLGPTFFMQNTLSEQPQCVPQTSILGSQGHHPRCPDASGLDEGVDVQVLQSSLGPAPTSLSGLTPTMGSTLKEIAKSGGQCQINSTELQQGSGILYKLYPLQNIGHPEHMDYSQQQQQEIPASGQQPHNVVVMSHPLDSLIQQSQSEAILSSVNPSAATTSLDLHHHPQDNCIQENLRKHLDSLATEQFIAQQIPLHLTSEYGTGSGARDESDV